MRFGDNLKQMRKSKNMSQEQLAYKVNVSRQSVSKWENSEAYPEMNNILELCKIFNCKINDLVHADMSDIFQLDEEIVMNVVKFNEQKQAQVKSLSNIIEMIGKVGGIVLKVIIPFLIITMLLCLFIINNIEIEQNELTFKNDNIKLIDNDKLEICGMIVAELNGNTSLQDIINIFNANSKLKIILYVEGGLLFLVVNIVIMIIILKYVERLFSNIKNKNTPFILENVNYIKKISYLMIALIMVNPLSDILFNTLAGINNSDSPFELITILEILIIFSMLYIFEYGYEIQKDSNGKMYGKANQ